MFLHLGGDVIVNGLDVIAILDLESASNGPSTNEFIKRSQSSTDVIQIGEEGKQKTLVITSTSLYLSPISSYTLLKRAQGNTFDFNVD